MDDLIKSGSVFGSGATFGKGASAFGKGEQIASQKRSFPSSTGNDSKRGRGGGASAYDPNASWDWGDSSWGEWGGSGRGSSQRGRGGAGGRGGGQVCKFHLQGWCKNGEWCHFEHPPVEGASTSKRDWNKPTPTKATKAAAPETAAPSLAAAQALTKPAAAAPKPALKSAASVSNSLAQCSAAKLL